MAVQKFEWLSRASAKTHTVIPHGPAIDSGTIRSRPFIESFATKSASAIIYLDGPLAGQADTYTSYNQVVLTRIDWFADRELRTSPSHGHFQLYVRRRHRHADVLARVLSIPSHGKSNQIFLQHSEAQGAAVALLARLFHLTDKVFAQKARDK